MATLPAAAGAVRWLRAHRIAANHDSEPAGSLQNSAAGYFRETAREDCPGGCHHFARPDWQPAMRRPPGFSESPPPACAPLILWRLAGNAIRYLLLGRTTGISFKATLLLGKRDPLRWRRLLMPEESPHFQPSLAAR